LPLCARQIQSAMRVAGRLQTLPVSLVGMLDGAKFWVEQLGLTPHPEGGYYRQTYRSAVTIREDALPPGFAGARPVATCIYFLLAEDNFSALHRLKSDEIWHFYAGGTVEVHVISREGQHSVIRLGADPRAGEVLQAVVPAGTWFGSLLPSPNSYALVGCTVAPGFDFSDFELGARAELVRLYPQHRELISRLTRT
jgi:uncharacterized protein